MDGSFSQGRLTQDVITFGNLTVENFEFIEQSLSSGDDFEGVVGMAAQGWDAPDGGPGELLFDHFEAAGNLDENVFCYWINKERTEAELILGGIDYGRNASELLWIPTLKDWHWTLSFGDILIHGSDEVVALSFDSSLSILFDTGSSVNYMSKVDAQRLHDAMHPEFYIWTEAGEDDQYEIDCDLMDSIPDIEMTFGGHRFLIDSEDYMMRFGTGSGQWCASSIIGSAMEDGESFMMV